MKCVITKCDHTGDSVLATCETDNKASIKVAQKALSDFLADCVTKYGKEPPVWGKRSGVQDFEPLKPGAEITDFEEVLVHQPVVGG